MRKSTSYLFAILFAAVLMTSCSRVDPNYQGVLMENYGTNGRADYRNVLGKVSTWGMGTELFQVPLWEQRASFADNGEGKTILHLEAADKTGFTVTPSYSYKVIADSASKLVFFNANLKGSGEEFMQKLEENVLETRIYDITKDEARSYTTDTLMLTGGSLKFENVVKEKVETLFKEQGLKLITFNLQIKVAAKAQEKIDQKNEVNQNIVLLDNQIAEQRKQNELTALKAEENRLESAGITDKLLQKKFIEKWDGKTPLYGNTPVTLMKAP